MINTYNMYNNIYTYNKMPILNGKNFTQNNDEYIINITSYQNTKCNVVNYVLQIQLLLTNNLTTAILQRNL